MKEGFKQSPPSHVYILLALPGERSGHVNETRNKSFYCPAERRGAQRSDAPTMI